MTNQTIQLAISITGSQKRLADLCGVAQPTVWRWLHGGGIDARYRDIKVQAITIEKAVWFFFRLCCFNLLNSEHG